MHIFQKRLFFFSVMMSLMGSVSADNSLLNLYMRNFRQPVLVESAAVVAEKKSLTARIAQGLWKYLKDPFQVIPPFPVTEQEKHYLIASQLHRTLKQNGTSVITPSVYKDLDVLYNDLDEKCSLLSACIETTTVCGNFYSAFLLANPTSNSDVLQKRQAIIRFLVEHEEVRSNLKNLLQELAEHETVVADFWKSDASKEYHARMLGGLYWSKTLPFLDFMDSSLALDHTFYTYSYVQAPLAWLGIEPVGMLSRYVFLAINNMRKGESTPHIADYYKAAYTGGSGLMFVLKNLNNPKFLWDYTSNNKLDSIGNSLWTTYIIWGGVQGLAYKKQVLDFVHKKMNKIASVARALKGFSDALNLYPELNANLESAERVHPFGGENPQASPRMKELLELLETNTFTTESQWSLRGRVKMAYHIFEEVKEELTDAFLAIGEIDAYVSAAELYKKHENSATPFTFALYDLESATASLEIHNMWNPLVVGDVIVANSVVLGVAGSAQNGILTGPNAGGKTTFLKGVAVGVLFAQTFGIAPAQFLRCTLFSKINTYVSIVDNIAAGQSLFMAEITRARELLQSTEENNVNNIFTLSIIDELLSGTAPEQGQAASYAIAKKLGGIPTSITLISTHFVDTMSKLEGDTGFFKNYKVSAEIRADGTIYYPFTVVSGVSSINVVDSILRKIGFDDQVMQDFENQLAA